MRGILAAASAATVAALSVGAPQAYTLTANVLTINGYSFGNIIKWDVNKIFQGSFCSEQSGNTCTEVRYLDGAPEVPAEVTGLIALRWALLTTPPPTTVVGFSQGATIASNWIKQNAGSPLAPSPENLSFVLAANPQRKYGGIRSELGFDTPTPDSEYSVTDIAIEYDGAADFPDNPLNILAVANALAGFQYVHIFGYADVDLENDEKLVWTEGNTTYVLIRRENIPLLEPLRILGFTELADRLNGPLKEIIDSAYDRNYPGLPESTLQPTAAQQISAAAQETPAVETVSADSQDAASTRTGRHAKYDPDELDDVEFDSPTGDVGEGSSGKGRHAAEESDDDQDTRDAAPSAGDDDADAGSTDGASSTDDQASSKKRGPASDRGSRSDDGSGASESGE